MPALALSLAIKNRNRKALEREVLKRILEKQDKSVKQDPSETNLVKQTKLKV